MLVLSRKLGEKIYISENICITVVDIGRGKVRLGIEAPRNVPIYREEVLPLVKQREAPAAPQPVAQVLLTDVNRQAAILRAEAQQREAGHA